MNLQEPIFIVGMPRSGTTWLGKILSHSSLLKLAVETNHIWTWGNSNIPDDLMLARHLTPRIQKHIERKISTFLIDQNSEIRFCDKTPRNCLRISFINAIFPDAKFVHIIRDPRAVTSSILRYANISPELVGRDILDKLRVASLLDLKYYLPQAKTVYKKIFLRQTLDYWGLRPPGWSEWVANNDSLCLIAAKQWVESIKLTSGEGSKLPTSRYVEVKYEDLIIKTDKTLDEILNFAKINSSDCIREYANLTSNFSKINSWVTSLTNEQICEIKPILESPMEFYGYKWDN